MNTCDPKKRIIVDADACPSLTSIINLARKTRTQVVLVGNETQNLSRFNGVAHVSVIEVPSGKDSADFTITPLATEHDIVITQDIGLASLVLPKGTVAISPRGKIFNPETIEYDLLLRYESQKARRAGLKTKGPSSYSMKDKQSLLEVLEGLLCKD